MRSLHSPAPRPARSFAMRVFLRASARSLPFEVLLLSDGQRQAVPTGARYPVQQLLRGRDKTTGFQGLRKNSACRIVFSGDFRKCARPWRDQTPERFSAAVPCKTFRRRNTSSKILCPPSLLFIFGSARVRPSPDQSRPTFLSCSNPPSSSVTPLPT